MPPPGSGLIGRQLMKGHRAYPTTDLVKFQFDGQLKSLPLGEGGRPKGGRMRESAKRKLYKVCIVASRHPHPSSISSKLNPPSPRGRLWALPRQYLINGNLYRGVVGRALWPFIYHPGGVSNWVRALPTRKMAIYLTGRRFKNERNNA